jgi:ribulose 1,5-bisphosphate synthetase/thiazole synthase
VSADPADPIPPLAVDDLQHGWLEEADVVVVGLGAAGLAASLELRAAT